MLSALNPYDSVVLIVEDDPDDARMLTMALEKFGIKKPFLAETAEEALTFLADQRCDVVLTDYNLPGMNGITLLEHIRESWPEIRVIVITGGRDERVAASAIKAGAVDYIAKDELLTSGIVRSLQTALRDKRAIKEDERHAVLSSSPDKLTVAREEIDWVMESFSGRLQLTGTGGDAPPDALAEDSCLSISRHGEGLDDLLDAFTRYLQASFRRFPDPATDEEEALARMLMERGASPSEVLMLFKGCLRSLEVEQVQPPFHPGVCLTRLFALLVEQYQMRQSFETLGRNAA